VENKVTTEEKQHMLLLEGVRGLIFHDIDPKKYFMFRRYFALTELEVKMECKKKKFVAVNS